MNKENPIDKALYFRNTHRFLYAISNIVDFCRYVKREETQKEEAVAFDAGPKLDLGFKEGQTIKINIKVGRLVI